VSPSEAGPARWRYPVLTALLSLAANPGAIWPDRTYFFRDYGITFQPLHDLFLRALRSGRWIFWNPYSYEGSALLPTLYPFDLLQFFVPGPIAASWLLTLHFPIAALGMYFLARELGASRPGACAAGALYSLCGLAQSSLNLWLFLEALALAPWLAFAVRRALLCGGRSVALAALVLGLSISTLAVEFVGQALLLGIVLALVASPRRPIVMHLLAVVALGLGLAALPILLTMGIVSESLRGEADIGALQRSLHPLSLLQTVVPNFFLSLAEPIRYGWSLRLFPESAPYFLSLYLGPLALAVAWNGLREVESRLRFALAGLAILGLWYALGWHAGLAGFLHPLLHFFRFPVKALLLPCLSVSVLAGLGVTRLGEGRGWGRLAVVAVGCTAIAIGSAVVAAGYGEAIGAWLGLRPEAIPAHVALLRHDAMGASLLALAALGVAWAVRRARLSAARGVRLVIGLLVIDLAHAAWGLNPQTSPLFFRPLPEMAPLVSGLEGGRVLSLGYALSPRMTEFIASGRPGVELGSFFLYRQVLNPFTNVLDDVELAGGPDLHSFIPNEPMIRLGAYRPEAIGGVTRELRNAAVTRVVSLEPIDHPDFALQAKVATGLPGFAIHVYSLADPWPRAYVACRVAVEPDRRLASRQALAEGFDPRRDVVLAQKASASCERGAVERREFAAGDEAYTVAANGPGVLVMRDSYTPSWRATIDGRPAPVLRANGRHRAVALPGGRHDVRVFYAPPFLRSGLAITAMAALLTGALVLRRASSQVPRGTIPD